jgi:hypothetical protein
LKPFYDARVGDLGLKDAILVTCLACGHSRRVKRWQILQVLPPHAFIQGMDQHMKCTRCKVRGRCEVRIELARRS